MRGRRLSTPISRRALLFLAAVIALPVAAGADPTPVDVVVREGSAPRRVVAIEYNPLPLFAIGKVSANLIIVPVDHHAIVLSPFYAWASTAPINVFDDAGQPTRLPEQRFAGFGGELGYRYYAGERGPRGFFVGPSLILGRFTATAESGEKTPFFDYGLAADVGYETLVADRVALSIGGGLQYIATSERIPDQQLEARIYANRGLLPRLLFSVGWSM